jgi:hypothetical protein
MHAKTMQRRTHEQFADGLRHEYHWWTLPAPVHRVRGGNDSPLKHMHSLRSWAQSLSGEKHRHADAHGTRYAQSIACEASMRPRKITDEKIPRLIEVARIKLQVEVLLKAAPVNKQLAYEIGITPKYLHNVMHRLTKILRMGQNVSHETLRRALFNDKEFGLLMDKLNDRADRKSIRAREVEGRDVASV